MLRTIWKWILVIVGLYLVIAVANVVTEAAHGLNDQDASYALALLLYCIDLPSVWLLRFLGAPMESSIPVALVGTVQWTLIAVALGALWHTLMRRKRLGNDCDAPGNPVKRESA